MDSNQLINVLLAVVLGFLGGWIVKAILAGGRRRREERDWQQQLDTCKESRESAARKVRQLRSRCAELESSFASLQSEMSGIRDNMEIREKSVNALRADLFDAKNKIQEVDTLRAKLAEREQKLIEMNKARAELARQAIDTSELESLRAQLDLVSQRAAQLEIENAELLEDRTSLTRSVEAAEQRAAQAPPPAQATPEPGPAAANSASLAALQRQLNQRTAVIDQLRKELAASRSHVSTFQQRLHQLEQAGRADSTPSPGRNNGSSAGMPGGAPAQIATTPVAADTTQAGTPDGTDDHHCIDGERQAALRDDLTQIRGIGDKLQEILYELGIVRFEQLARMTEVELDELSEKLPSFKNRPVRDDWVGQARELMGPSHT